MSDLISRKAAINVLKALEKPAPTAQHLSAIFDCEDAIKALPSAEPERKKGRWVYDGIRGRFPACKCSICGYYENADWALLQGVNYCPNCGADMRGD